ncbi:hypothetical protein AGATL06_22290 [Agathobaculum sp. TL06]
MRQLGRFAACGPRETVRLRGAGAQEGRHPRVSPLLRITPFPFRARYARKGK